MIHVTESLAQAIPSPQGTKTLSSMLYTDDCSYQGNESKMGKKIIRRIMKLLQAILSRQRAETLSSVLYPDDRTYQGKELRLKQQHFFVSATIQVRQLWPSYSAQGFASRLCCLT